MSYRDEPKKERIKPLINTGINEEWEKMREEDKKKEEAGKKKEEIKV